MNDFFIGIGLVFVIEGLLWALFPNVILGMLESAKEMPETNLRFAGALCTGFGVFLVWLIRG